MPVVILGAGLLVFFGATFLIGLSRAHDYSLGALLTAVGTWFQQQARITVAGVTVSLAFIGTAIINLDNTIRNAIGEGIEAMAAPAVAVVARVALAFEAIGQAVAGVGAETERALWRMLRSSIPALIATKLAATIARLHSTEVITHWVTHTLPQKVERVATITKVYPVTVQRVAGLPALVDAAVDSALAAAAIPHALPHTGDLTKGVGAIWDQIRRLGKYATVAGLAGLVGATVFSHFGLSWLRCSNVNKTGKALCGFNTSRLEALLAGLALWLGTLDLATFAKDVQGVTHRFEGEVRHFWRANVTGPGHDRALGQTGL